MSAGYEYNYSIERERRREMYLSRIRENTRVFLNKYENILRSVEEQELTEFVEHDFYNARNKLNEAQNSLQRHPERAREISQNIGKNVGTMPKRAKERRRIYNQQEKQQRVQNKQQEKQKEQNKQRLKRQQENLKTLQQHINTFVQKYENILNDIESKDLSKYIAEEYNQAVGEIGNIRKQINTNPEYAKELSISLGEWLNQLPKLAQANKTQDIKLQKEKEEAERKRQQFLDEQRKKEKKKLQQEFQYLIDESLLKLHDPVLRDYALDDLTKIVDSYKQMQITSTNFEEIKTNFIAQTSQILKNAQLKADEFNKKYFQEAEEIIEKETLIEQIEEEKKNIQKISSDNPEKLKSLMDNLLSVEDDLKNNNLENIDNQLSEISDSIINEEVNEEYRRHTVKSIFEILNKLGFTPSKPKKQNGDVVLTAQRANGNNFEAKIKLDGSMTSHFDGYSYDACKDDIENLEDELQSCYGIDLAKTKTIWQNPDRIQKNAKPISELNRQG